MANLNKEELKALIGWDGSDVSNHIYIPNTIFEMLAKDEELNKSNGNIEGKQARKSTHVAEAYCYLVLITYLYRNCKYFDMEDVSMKKLQTVIGYSYDYKKFNYVIKKDGVLDKLGLTTTISLKDAPIMVELVDGTHPNFITKDDLSKEQLEDLKEVNAIKNVKNTKIKEPTFALYNEDGEYGEGTFFGANGNTANTHKIDMEVFIECLTNDNLGCTAFYLYNFLTWKSITSRKDCIEIGLETITQRTGVLRGARDKALHGLKAHQLIFCVPAPFVVGAYQGSDMANIYSVGDMESFNTEMVEYQVRVVFHIDNVEMSADIKEERGN